VLVGGVGGVVVVVVGGGGGGGDAVVVVAAGGDIVAGDDVGEEGASVVGGAAGATTGAAGGVSAEVDRWLVWDWVWSYAVVGVLGALVVVEGGAAVDDAVDGGTVGGGTVEMVCIFTPWPAAPAGRVGLFEWGVRTKAIPSMATMRPRPTHMPHWRVGDRSAVTAAAPGSG
jgi:hypothetical protein